MIREFVYYYNILLWREILLFSTDGFHKIKKKKNEKNKCVRPIFFFCLHAFEITVFRIHI